MHHRVEITGIPRNCLDVLAQQIVAMVGDTPVSMLERALLLFLREYWNTGRPRPFREVHLHYLNGERPGGSATEQLLRGVGFYRDMDQTMRWSDYR